MADTQHSTPTPIFTMHARYEAAMAAQNTLDVADLALGKSEQEQRLASCYSTAAATADAEADALRRAILYQVPTNWTDAMVLQFHIYVSIDLFGQDAPQHEREALLVATDTLFDFMACELPEDHETIGREFQRATNRVFDRRRFRTGLLEA